MDFDLCCAAAGNVTGRDMELRATLKFCSRKRNCDAVESNTQHYRGEEKGGRDLTIPKG